MKRTEINIIYPMNNQYLIANYIYFLQLDIYLTSYPPHNEYQPITME